MEKHDWKVAQIHNAGKPFSILHSNFEPTSKSLSILLLSVSPDEDSGSLHVKHTVFLTVIVFSGEAGENGEMKFGFEVQKEFQSHSVPLYGALESSNQAVLVASEKPFTLVTEKNGEQFECKQLQTSFPKSMQHLRFCFVLVTLMLLAENFMLLIRSSQCYTKVNLSAN